MFSFYYQDSKTGTELIVFNAIFLIKQNQFRSCIGILSQKKPDIFSTLKNFDFQFRVSPKLLT